jgi:DivIVA domain-containing protein
MPFAPHEIENKRFVVALRGYATAEVDAFLRAVAADYAAALQAAASPSDPEREAARILEAAQLEAEAVYAELDRRAAELAEREAEVRGRLAELQEALAEAARGFSPHVTG